MNTQFKVKALTLGDQLIGMKVPPRFNGAAGFYVEQLLSDLGYNMSSTGIDIPDIRVEVKSRDLDATSPQTVTSTQAATIVATDYEDSAFCEKLQQQFRVYTRYEYIVEAGIHDFSNKPCQKYLKDLYTKAQKCISDQLTLLANGSITGLPLYIRLDNHCRLEINNPNTQPERYSFRFTNKGYAYLKDFDNNMFYKLFEFVE